MRVVSYIIVLDTSGHITALCDRSLAFELTTM